MGWCGDITLTKPISADALTRVLMKLPEWCKGFSTTPQAYSGRVHWSCYADVFLGIVPTVIGIGGSSTMSGARAYEFRDLLSKTLEEAGYPNSVSELDY